jgi:thioredoxin reductase
MSFLHSLTTNLVPNYFTSIARNLTTTTANMPLVDALIIGAGPAGLSAALALARQLHTAVVFNSSLFRNARSEHMHTIPTWDHKDPAAFRGATRKEILERYNTISFKDCEVAKVEKTSVGDFAATAVDGTTFTGRRVLLASGVTDLPLDIQGYDECWGRSMCVFSHSDILNHTNSSSYHCLFCHGYEDVGKPSAGILALGEISSPAAATALARSAKQITSKVVIYTSNNPGVQTAIADLLGQNNTAITTDDREIASLALGSEGSGIIITFADGSSVQEAFLAHKPPTKLNGPFAEQLGVELAPGGDIQVTPPFGATSVKGVYAAGDCAAKMKNVMQAMHMGTFAGVGMAHDLQAEGPKI